MVKSITVIKKPIVGAVHDTPPRFPPFSQLFLQHLEVKSKLKPGVQKIFPNPPEYKPTNVKPEASATEVVDTPREKSKSEGHRKKSKSKSKKTITPAEISDEDDDDDGGDVDDELLETDSEPEGSDDEGSGGEDGSDAEGSDEGSDAEGSDTEEDDNLTPEERERLEKQRLLKAFRTLKLKYPESKVPIPDFSEHSDINIMKTTFQNVEDELKLNSNIEYLQMYFIQGNYGLEFVLTNIFGMNMDGFGNHQAKNIARYRALLVEMGEREYVTITDKLPVELRLLLAIGMSAVMFYMMKRSPTFKAMHNSIPGTQHAGGPPVGTGQDQTKTRMRPPPFSAEEIKKMA